MNYKLIIPGILVVGVGLWLALRSPSSPDQEMSPSNPVVTTEAGQMKGQPKSNPKPSVWGLNTLTEIPQEQLSPETAVAVGLTGKVEDYNARMKGVNALGRELSHTDILALTAFLKTPHDEAINLDLREFNAIKNDIMTALVEQKEMIPNLGIFLTELAANRDLDEVCRDYAVQFFPYVYQRNFESGSVIAQGDAERSALVAGFTEAFGELDTTLPGTALLAVDYLSSDYPELAELNAGEAAANVLSSNGSTNSQITALLIGSKSHNEVVMQYAREIAQIGDSIPLRLAAVNALAQSGKAEDIALLEPITQEEDKILSAAATNAITKLSNL